MKLNFVLSTFELKDKTAVGLLLLTDENVISYVFLSKEGSAFVDPWASLHFGDIIIVPFKELILIYLTDAVLPRLFRCASIS